MSSPPLWTRKTRQIKQAEPNTNQVGTNSAIEEPNPPPNPHHRQTLSSSSRRTAYSEATSYSATMPKVKSSNNTKAANENAPKADKTDKPKRAPTAYNLFMKRELARWKAQNPDAQQKEAFTAVRVSIDLFFHVHCLHYGFDASGRVKTVFLDLFSFFHPLSTSRDHWLTRIIPHLAFRWPSCGARPTRTRTRASQPRKRPQRRKLRRRVELGTNPRPLITCHYDCAYLSLNSPSRVRLTRSDTPVLYSLDAP